MDTTFVLLFWFIAGVLLGAGVTIAYYRHLLIERDIVLSAQDKLLEHFIDESTPSSLAKPHRTELTIVPNLDDDLDAHINDALRLAYNPETGR